MVRVASTKSQLKWINIPIEELILNKEFNAEVNMMLKPPAERVEPIYTILERANEFFEFINILYGSGWRL